MPLLPLVDNIFDRFILTFVGLLLLVLGGSGCRLSSVDCRVVQLAAWELG